MTTQPDPRVTQALNLIATVGGLLDRAERVLRSAEPGAVTRPDLVLRGLLQANHALSQAWNAALAEVPERKPEPPPEPPKVPPRAPEPKPYDPTIHRLAQRVLAEGDE